MLFCSPRTMLCNVVKGHLHAWCAGLCDEWTPLRHQNLQGDTVEVATLRAEVEGAGGSVYAKRVMQVFERKV